MTNQVPATSTARGLYFEEFQTGATFSTRGRTITETDIVSFAGLTGDYNPMHTDAEYARSTMFGERIAHGMLGLSYTVGMVYQLGFLEKTILAFTEVNWKFRAPIKIGDTIHIEIAIGELKDAPKMGGGLVTSSLKAVNQNGVTTQRGEMTFLMMHRPAEAAPVSEPPATP
jgi:acyl dehydratase